MCVVKKSIGKQLSRNNMAMKFLTKLLYFYTAHILCGAGSMHLSGAHLSVCPSVGLLTANLLLQECCCGPGWQEIIAAQRVVGECG